MGDSMKALTGRIGGYAKWARTDDWTKATEKARQAERDRYDKLVDPDGTLPPEVRRKKAEAARREHYSRMGQASAKARRERAEARKAKAAGKSRIEVVPRCECGVELANEVSHETGKCFRCRQSSEQVTPPTGGTR